MKKIFLIFFICIILLSFANAETICIDLDPPSAPSNLVLTRTNGNVLLSWDASTDVPDCSGLLYYKIYRNGNWKGTTVFLNFTDEGVPVGTYTYKIIALDKARHESMPVEGNITIPAIGVGVTGMTGGGGGAGTAIVSFNEGENSMQKNVEYEFIIKNKAHTIKVKEVGEDYVILLIYSEPKEIRLRIGETKEIDIDNDNKPDISLKLVSILGSGKVEIDYKIIEETETQESTGPVSLGNNETSQGQAPITGGVIGALRGTIGMTIGIIFIIGILVAFTFIRLRKR